MMNPLVNKAVVTSRIADDVLAGLSKASKSLPPWLFYDAIGSKLFEQITELPEYYLTRTEREIFAEHANEMIDAARTGAQNAAPENLTVIELGAGTASKTRILMAAVLSRQFSATFYPIDVSETALRIAEDDLESDFPGLKVRPLLGDYSQGLNQLASTPGRKLVLYIGSSIGNFELSEAGNVLRSVGEDLRPGDALLLGVDLVKDAGLLRAAYNDSQGVTAQFNLNILARINRELGADFDLSAFRHVAEWNQQASCMEIYVESLRAQTVWIADIGMKIQFHACERIHTENSYKFTDAMVDDVVSAGGFTLERCWKDPKGWFGVYLARI
jgi:dimethylhistidine N-methyltransferase